MRNLFVIGLVSMVGCSEYELSKPQGELPGESRGDAAVEAPLDTGEAPVDTGVAPVDTGVAPVDTGEAPVDTGEVPVDTDDGCYDPSTAYDMHPAAGLVVTGSDALTATYLGSDAGYTSELYLNSPVNVYIATGHATATGTATGLGAFTPGTELVFSILVTNSGDTFLSGPASRNADCFRHAAITYSGDCVWLVGFEDSYGGGDQDFDDIILEISGPMEMQLVP